mmetsp:Transcript_29058/g.51079  ORF Transcript_29058/g.51079 Transcript_29058/m.51079 type:complete len:285 (-) Transcript_29058:691-1545(-)
MAFTLALPLNSSISGSSTFFSVSILSLSRISYITGPCTLTTSFSLTTFLAAASGSTLNPTTIAFVIAAISVSDVLIGPTPEFRILISIHSLFIFSTSNDSASRLPWVSARNIIDTSCDFLLSAANNDALSTSFSFWLTCVLSFWRLADMALASFSVLNPKTRSPDWVQPDNPNTSTGVPGVACLIGFSLSSSRLRTFPYSAPAKMTEPFFNVPDWTRSVVIGPLYLSILDSTTTPLTCPSVGALTSRISACSRMFSRSPSTPSPDFAEISETRLSPPHSSGMRS